MKRQNFNLWLGVLVLGMMAFLAGCATTESSHPWNNPSMMEPAQAPERPQ